jgi:hypothetical protein
MGLKKLELIYGFRKTKRKTTRFAQLAICLKQKTIKKLKQKKCVHTATKVLFKPNKKYVEGVEGTKLFSNNFFTCEYSSINGVSLISIKTKCLPTHIDMSSSHHQIYV